MLLVVAQRESGKSTHAFKMAEASGKRIIVVSSDPQDFYNEYKQISISQIKVCDANKVNIHCNDEEEAAEIAVQLNKYQANAFIIFEDAQKYLNDNLQKDVLRLIINHRHRNFDLLFMYHYLKFVPPKIACNYNVLLLGHTSDGNVNLSSKYGNWKRILKSIERIEKNSDPHYFEAIYDNER